MSCCHIFPPKLLYNETEVAPGFTGNCNCKVKLPLLGFGITYTPMPLTPLLLSVVVIEVEPKAEAVLKSGPAPLRRLYRVNSNTGKQFALIETNEAKAVRRGLFD